MIIIGFCSAFLGIPFSLLLPFIALTLAIIPKTRKFGLGMLLGCGAILLILLAVCGGYALMS